MTNHIQSLIDRGALFVVNHSGGKDSQAMTIKLQAMIPAAQLVLVHAVLPEVDWDGIEDHIRASHPGLPLHTTQAPKTFFQMVERRGMFPSPTLRQCTSDLKRDPIERTIRQICRKTGAWLIVNCMGLRADESSARAKAVPFKVNKRMSAAGREVYDWLPIHDLSTAEVFRTIASAGQQPHWAYQAGMTRLSCCFCIMASKADLVTAARLRPELARRYAETERKLNVTMLMPAKSGVREFLDEWLPIAA
jgi:3'-phosphoadenosine 5'-phosphosulfate sulfotransferase (PAPS reductase)/FAD synthetase